MRGGPVEQERLRRRGSERRPAYGADLHEADIAPSSTIGSRAALNSRGLT
jgi:hypothetical protein